jgi:hypothetical protein
MYIFPEALECHIENNLEFKNSSSILHTHLFFCFITDVNIFIVIYLVDSMRSAFYSFSFLCAMEETLCCGAKVMFQSTSYESTRDYTIHVCKSHSSLSRIVNRIFSSSLTHSDVDCFFILELCCHCKQK